jgi:uncharacterized lipoprotein YajG
MNYRSSIWCIFSLLLGSLLAGCSTTPQIVPVNPALDVNASRARGSGRILALAVVDARGGHVVGYRDPGDESTAITSAPEALRNIERALRDGYERLGFSVVEAGTAADIALEVRLVEFVYERESGGVIRDVNTGATVEATSVMRTKTVNSVYSDQQGKETLLKPSLQDNAAFVNRRLSEALSQLLGDEKLTTE